MIEIISIMLAGIAVGWLLRKHSFKIVGGIIIVLVWALLFFLQNLGLEALLLSVAATAGSIACAWALWRYIQRKEGCNQ